MSFTLEVVLEREAFEPAAELEELGDVDLEDLDLALLELAPELRRALRHEDRSAPDDGVAREGARLLLGDDDLLALEGLDRRRVDRPEGPRVVSDEVVADREERGVEVVEVGLLH